MSVVATCGLQADLQRALEALTVADCSHNECSECGVCGDDFGDNVVAETPPIPEFEVSCCLLLSVLEGVHPICPSRGRDVYGEKALPFSASRVTYFVTYLFFFADCHSYSGRCVYRGTKGRTTQWRSASTSASQRCFASKCSLYLGVRVIAPACLLLDGVVRASVRASVRAACSLFW